MKEPSTNFTRVFIAAFVFIALVTIQAFLTTSVAHAAVPTQSQTEEINSDSNQNQGDNQQQETNCKKITLKELKNVIKNKKSSTDLVFFSTWCSECKTELINMQKDPKRKDKFILINTFDEAGRATNVLKNLHVDMPCYYDVKSAIAKNYNVKAVPLKISFPKTATTKKSAHR